jgi:hypothetical protein
MLSRIVNGLVFGGPTVLAFATAYFGWSIFFPWWGWALTATVTALFIVLWRLLQRAYSLEKALQPEIRISDPRCYFLPWKDKSVSDKGERHFFVTIENLGVGHIKNCSLKEVAFKNRFDHTAPESGRVFRKKLERRADRTTHTYERYFDLRGKGDTEEIEICYMDETQGVLAVVMTYATTPSHAYKDSIPRGLFPHELTVRVTADNLAVPIEKTFIIDVTSNGYLSVETLAAS